MKQSSQGDDSPNIGDGRGDVNVSGSSSPSDRSIWMGGNKIRGAGYVEQNRGSVYTEGNTYYFEGDVHIARAIAASSRAQSEKILLKQVGAEIASRLRQSLHNQIFIDLGKENQPQQVERPWDYEVKIGSRISEKLPANTPILEVFRREDVGDRLLILGRPEAGKTTTLLDLARGLWEQAQDPGEPIPVLVGLSSWAIARRSMGEWLAGELQDKYGLRWDIGQKWLQEGKLVPLLDGLDEVRSEAQGACLEALNDWITGDSFPGRLVVCSRLEEYEQLQMPLRMNGAICLTELSGEQVRGYLQSVGCPHLWPAICESEALRELVRAPLFLSMMVIAERAAPEEMQGLQGAEDATSFLIDAYIGEMLKGKMLKRATIYTPRQIRRWLVWLAKQMEIQEQTEFLVENIQPSWLRSDRLVRAYYLRVWLIVGLIGGLSYWLIRGWSFFLIWGLIIWTPGISSLQAIERALSNNSSSYLFQKLFEELGFVLIGGVSLMFLISWSGFGLIVWLIVWLIEGVNLGLSLGLVFGLTFGLGFGLSFGIVTYIQRFVMRYLLYTNDFTPWNYARFLTECSDRLLLQRIGGRFRFIHKTVQEHFAAMD